MDNSGKGSRGSEKISGLSAAAQKKGLSTGSRRKSREAALQALYLIEMNPHDPVDSSLAVFSENFPVTKGSQPYFFRLVHGVKTQKDSIDSLIKNFAEHWRIERMSGVDRNILRLAVYELIYCEDIPPRVAINEAIDLGKQFGTEESGAFINGILDRIYLERYGKTDVTDIKGEPA